MRNLERAHDWFKRAKSNMARARAGRVSSEVLYEDLCYDAQQAVEKALKSLCALERTERSIRDYSAHEQAHLFHPNDQQKKGHGHTETDWIVNRVQLVKMVKALNYLNYQNESNGQNDLNNYQPQ